MATSQLHITGPPVFTRTISTASGPVVDTLTLPLPDFTRHMAASYSDRSVFAGRLDSTQRIGEGRNLPVFQFGYRFLPVAIKQEIALWLRLRAFDFKPRTARADESAYASEETTYSVRPVSSLPLTEHLTRGFDIIITLEALDIFVHEGA